MLGVEAHAAQQLLDPVGPLRLGGAELVDVDGLSDDLSHGHAGVQRGGGVLKDDLHFPAVRQHIHRLLPGHPFADELGLLHRRAVLAPDGDRLCLKGIFMLIDGLPPVQDGAGGGLMEAEDGAPQGGLAAAGLAHQPQGLPLVDGKGHVLHRLYAGALLALDGEILGQVVHLDEDILIHGSPPPRFRSFPAPTGPVPAASRPSGGLCRSPHRAASS